MARVARALIADPGNDVLVSVASLREIVGKLRADIGAIERAVVRDGFEQLAITRAHLAVLTNLPLHHRDPFDQLLIAQALDEGALLVSVDQNMPLCPVRLMSCSEG